MAYQKVALCCLCVPRRPPTAWEHRRTQAALSITIKGGERSEVTGRERVERGDRVGETMLLSYYPLEITDQCHNYYLEVKLIW